MEKERKKAEKDAKFAAKKAKQTSSATTAPAEKKNDKKAKAEGKDAPLSAYVEETTPGEKKSKLWSALTL